MSTPTDALRVLLDAIHKARDVAYKAPELNTSNYTHEQVVELNDAMCEVFTQLDVICAQLAQGTPAQPELINPVGVSVSHDGLWRCVRCGKTGTTRREPGDPCFCYECETAQPAANSAEVPQPRDYDAAAACIDYVEQKLGCWLMACDEQPVRNALATMLAKHYGHALHPNAEGYQT